MFLVTIYFNPFRPKLYKKEIENLCKSDFLEITQQEYFCKNIFLVIVSFLMKYLNEKKMFISFL